MDERRSPWASCAAWLAISQESDPQLTHSGEASRRTATSPGAVTCHCPALLVSTHGTPAPVRRRPGACARKWSERRLPRCAGCQQQRAGSQRERKVAKADGRHGVLLRQSTDGCGRATVAEADQARRFVARAGRPDCDRCEAARRHPCGDESVSRGGCPRPLAASRTRGAHKAPAAWVTPGFMGMPLRTHAIARYDERRHAGGRATLVSRTQGESPWPSTPSTPPRWPCPGHRHRRGLGRPGGGRITGRITGRTGGRNPM